MESRLDLEEIVSHDLHGLPEQAVQLAAEILQASREKETVEERTRSGLMARMMSDEPGKKFTIAMADQVLRMKRPELAARRMLSLIDEYGIPRYFAAADQWRMRVGASVSRFAPRLVMPFVRNKVRQDSAHVIISAEPGPFGRYLAQRRNQKIRVNFNQLGEAVLGEHEASRRLAQYVQRLQKVGIDYCSVKLSSIASQISLTGYDQTVDLLKQRLRTIYRNAIQGGGRRGPKFVNLDMEEYRDLHLTVDTFQAVLDEPEFENLTAGIVLQAYLPDSFAVLKSLISWAAKRHLRCGSGVKIRIVKGANLAMEQVEAGLHGWPQAPYTSKRDVDANFKRMLEFASRREHALYLRIGVASHNLFDLAWALLLRQRRGAERQIEFEMLEGMANAQAIEIRNRTGDLIVYTPVCFEHEFESAVAYLVRRLDENTAPGSFLGALFGLQEGTPQWNQQRDGFLAACQRAFDPQLSDQPNRRQDRMNESIEADGADIPFFNVADTDFSLPQNRQWVREIVSTWLAQRPEEIPIQIDAEFVTGNRLTGIGTDPSRPELQVAYRFAQGNADDVEVALHAAAEAQPDWHRGGAPARAEILRNAAAIIGRQRGELIGTMLLDAGKAVFEADVEVSEAIDFANYYARSFDEAGWFDGAAGEPIGIVVVTPPWNFPYAIPAGGVMAALMAGNAVILKPARESVLTAWQLVKQLWQAGVPKKVLQFLPLVDGATGKKLISDPRVGGVILTGSYQTAAMFQSWRPDLKLFAETSGKNSMIISVSADVDLAIKDLVKGAFGHAGQKCSATSLALVQKEIYDNPRFMEQLKDAAESLHVGPSWDTSSVVTPVIRKPDETLERGLLRLEEGESWLLKPRMLDNNPCLWSPGIRIGVQPGNWYHRHECFGPVLGVMRVDSFEQAIRIQNSSPFGLTGGLHSLDPAEIATWRERVEVGNAYVNRSTTGAIVRRQPFGGWKDSCVGPGAKAGGKNYVAALCHWSNHGLPTKLSEPDRNLRHVLSCLQQLKLGENTLQECRAAAGSYSYWWQHEFSVVHDPSQIHGESNHFRYRPRPWHIVRIGYQTPNPVPQVALVLMACLITNTSLQVSSEQAMAPMNEFLQVLAPMKFSLEIESEAELASRLNRLAGGTVRLLSPVDRQVLSPERIGNIPIFDSPPLLNGRIELLSYLREQSVSEIVHRYGNII